MRVVCRILEGSIRESGYLKVRRFFEAQAWGSIWRTELIEDLFSLVARKLFIGVRSSGMLDISRNEEDSI